MIIVQIRYNNASNACWERRAKVSGTCVAYAVLSLGSCDLLGSPVAIIYQVQRETVPSLRNSAMEYVPPPVLNLVPR